MRTKFKRRTRTGEERRRDLIWKDCSGTITKREKTILDHLEATHSRFFDVLCYGKDEAHRVRRDHRKRMRRLDFYIQTLKTINSIIVESVGIPNTHNEALTRGSNFVLDPIFQSGGVVSPDVGIL